MKVSITLVTVSLWTTTLPISNHGLSELCSATTTSTTPAQEISATSLPTLARQLPLQSVTTPPCTSTPPDHTMASHGSQTQVQPKFPSTSTRQRSSNINLGDPELEFLKTALSACRSTISQQEAELKRLNECLNIRNKRIIQLESQVGHASDYISARTPSPDVPESSLCAISEKLDLVTRKVERLETAPSNNIVVNSCHPSQQHHYSIPTQSTVTQTDSSTDNSDSHDNTENICPEKTSLVQTQPMQTL